MRGFNLAAMAVSAGLLAGCASVYTSRHLGTDTTDANGLVYALPTTWLEIAGAHPDDAGVKRGDKVVVTISTKELPDAGAFYSLEHMSSAFASDELIIDVGPDQLLDRVYAKTEDATDQIIVALAKTVSGVANFSVPGGLKAADRGDAFACSPPPAPPFTFLIDPFNQKTWPRWLNDGCLILTPIAAGGAPPSSAKTRPPEDCRKGVCYRAPVPYRIGFDFGPAGYREAVAGLLNDAPVLSVSVDRSMFVQNEINLVFDNGVLSKMEMKKPSSALAVASLPLDVAKAVLSAPAEIFKLRVDYSSQAIADMEKEKALIEAQQKFEEFKQSLDDGEAKAGDGK